MKRMIGTLLCVMVSALCMAGTAQIVNPGFESMSGNPLAPNNWTLYTGSGATVYFAAKTDVVRTGTYSEKVAARQGYGTIYQEISSGFAVGETYSFWIYGRGDTNGDWIIDEPLDRIELSARFKNSSGGTISEPMVVAFDGDPGTAAPILVNTGWLTSSVLRFTVPAGTASILFKISAIDSSVDGNTKDGTSIYIDDVTLDILPLPAQNPSPAAGALEQNPSSLFLSWQPGDDPYHAGTPDPNITGYYVYLDQFSASEPGEPNFVNPVYVTGTQYPAAAPGLALGADQIVYWRVDSSIDGSSATDPNTVRGATWSFTTQSSFPEITAQPQDVVVSEGQTAVLTVEASGTNPIVLYQWYDSSDTLVDSGAALNSLTITDAAIEDSDSYYCVVTNDQNKATQSDSARVYVKGLLAQYDFENNLSDATGRHDGTAKSLDPNIPAVITYDAGISGSAAVLDGASYIELPQGGFPNSFMGLASGTIGCWVKTTNAQTETIMAAYNTGLTTCINLSIQNADTVYFFLRSEGNHVAQIQRSVPGIKDGQWHYMAVTYELGGQVAVYVDGEQLFTVGGLPASAQFLPWTYTLPIGAGDARGVISNLFKGSMDGLVIYNYARTPKEILDMYNAVAEPDKSLCLNEYASAFDLAGPGGVGTAYADCKVNLFDFAAMAASWLDCGLYPECGG